jgi:hypothetical protein
MRDGRRAIICLAGWKLPMNSFDKMLEWFPHTSREWIELIIVTVLLWLLMMAIFELELAQVPDQWRSNLANNLFASSCDSRRPPCLIGLLLTL